jgi:hypothetical protein
MIVAPDQAVKFKHIPTPSGKTTKFPRQDICFRSISQISAHSDTITKNDEFATGAIFVSDQSVKFWPITTPSRKMTKFTPARFLFPINQSNFSPFDTVAKNDEIAPGAIFVSDQSIKFRPMPTPSRKMTKFPPA